ncbi:family 20 glycosylhydrolase [Actinomadura barringtoniae]|uniref:beta-N-acetylhexosaminidase n=1 Tax=Actinomadura barringtoniae TaxID=1427535 RepID=A0A939T9Z6_9ACTN|nr:family 20 glycosylhydrolase [Actinomadura barringtoniae]MBO2455618.1 family 20 glycosylhydrolase [Actinomadura barringtoniae]
MLLTSVRLTSVALAVTLTSLGAAPVAEAKPVAPRPLNSVVPAPVSVAPKAGADYRITAKTVVHTDQAGARVGESLARLLRRSTGYKLPVRVDGRTGDGISFVLGTGRSGGSGHAGGSGDARGLGDEGYRLEVARSSITVRAGKVGGLVNGLATLHQLLPYAADAARPQPGPWPVAGGQVVDRPRYAYRSAMLDVSRHFFGVQAVQRYIDQIALYKINHLHLHLSDDQGWRIAIDSWPRLATYGGSTAVDGDPGGYFTKADYKRIIAYAAERNITIVPEIDMPGHTNAALASYAQLNCDGVAPPLYTGTDVGFSSLCTSKEITYTFLDQVIGELAAMTPGPYIHIGGDEAQSTKPADYAAFINRVQPIVARHGKTVVGWHDVVRATPLPSTVAQFWGTENTDEDVAAAAKKGTTIIMSPANKAYIDMKYNPQTPLGQDWAGLIEVDTAYGWDPGNYLQGVPADRVRGIEAPLWTETIRTSADIEYMAFPRLPALAELGWSPQATHDWSAFRQRLGAQGPRWKVQGVNYYRSTQIDWPAGS